MIGLGLRRAPEGWRRTVGILLTVGIDSLRDVGVRLRVPRATAGTGHADSLDTRTAHALLSFLAKEPDAHFRLDWRRPVTLRRRIPFVDLVVLRFAAESTLEVDRTVPRVGERLRPVLPTCGRRCTTRSSRHTTRRAAFQRSKDRAYSRIAFALLSGRLSSVTGCKPRTRTRSGCLAPAVFRSSGAISRIPRSASAHPNFASTTHARLWISVVHRPHRRRQRFGRSLGQLAPCRARRRAAPGPPRSARA